MNSKTTLQTPLLSLRDIVKSYGGLCALGGVSVDFHAGRVHGLVGENGAGKSTLMKVLTGAELPDSGQCVLSGESIVLRHPREAREHGIAIVHQELNLFPNRTITQNIFAGRELVSYRGLKVGAMRQRVAEVLHQLDLDLDPDDRVGDLSIASQQMIEIAKSVAFDARVLVFDEPTATLAEDDCRILFGLIRRLRSEGLAIIYISHRMAEIFDLCDEVTVVKDGLKALTAPISDVTAESLVAAMIGRRLEEYYPPRPVTPATPATTLRIVSGANKALSNIDLEIRGGEVTGIFGLKGSGRSELAYALWGSPGFSSGQVEIDGHTADLSTPHHAMHAGLGFVPESRKSEGLALDQSIRDNFLLAARVTAGWASGLTVATELAVDAVLARVALDPDDQNAPVASLSGGNQQKVVLAKWLLTDAKILVLAEPTRGVDVGAKAAIYELIRKLADEGRAILVLSSELPEILGISDRVLVIRDRRLVAEFPPTATEAEILLEAGGKVNE